MPKNIFKSRKLRKLLFSTASPKKNKTRLNSVRDANIFFDEVANKQSYKLINIAGYIILSLVFFDYLFLGFPPQIFNPTWELQTLGRVIETLWAPILGFILVFYRRQEYSVKKRELKLLSWLSRCALILGICYLLAVPLLITDTFRIVRDNYAQLTWQLTNRNHKVEQFSQQLELVNDSQLSNFRQQYPEYFVDSASSPQEIKQKILQKIEREKQQSQETLEQNFAKQKMSAIKMSVKWLLQALIGGTFFILMWRYTKWIRVIGKR
jgi:hypothetical protein